MAQEENKTVDQTDQLLEELGCYKDLDRSQIKLIRHHLEMIHNDALTYATRDISNLLRDKRV